MASHENYDESPTFTYDGQINWRPYFLQFTHFANRYRWSPKQRLDKLIECSIEEFEDTKGVVRIRKSKKDRQHNGKKKKDKQRSTKYYT